MLVKHLNVALHLQSHFFPNSSVQCHSIQFLIFHQHLDSKPLSGAAVFTKAWTSLKLGCLESPMSMKRVHSLVVTKAPILRIRWNKAKMELSVNECMIYKQTSKCKKKCNLDCSFEYQLFLSLFTRHSKLLLLCCKKAPSRSSTIFIGGRHDFFLATFQWG